VRTVRLDEFMPRRLPSINPAKFQSETFELWSVPSFDVGAPVILKGSEIGSSKKVVESGDLLLSRIVPHIRRAWIVEPSTAHRQIGSGEWITFRGEDFHAPYLRHILISDRFNAQLMQTIAGVGGSLLRARPESVREIEIPLPPLPEQKRIAAILDQADALRKNRQRALDRLGQLGQSIFYEMFGDPIKNTKDFKKLPLSDLVRIRRGGSPRPIKNFIGGTVPWIKIGDATKGDELYLWETKVKIHESGLNRTVLVEPDSLIFANCGVSLGFARVTKIQGAIHDGWLVFDEFSSKLNQLFLLSLINFITPRLRDMAPDGTQPNLNTKIMGALPIILPSIKIQNSFVATILHLRAHSDLLVQDLDKFNTLFASLQQRAFRGEL